jgi:hypothetical protein
MALLVLACDRQEPDRAGQQRARDSSTSADTTRADWPKDGARVVERQLQRELYTARDTGFMNGVRNCDEGGEEEPPPGLALVRAVLADKPVVSTEPPNQATIRGILTSVASTKHHPGGDQVDIDVDVGVRVDTVEFLIEKDDAEYSVCYPYLFLHRGAVDWAVVRKWTPPNASWAAVGRLADSLTRSRPR